jgi:hypothetical protein
LPWQDEGDHRIFSGEFKLESRRTMPTHSDSDRRTFVRRAVAALALARLDLLRFWQTPLHRVEGRALANELSALDRATAWINSPALTAASLQGKVVLVQFCTFTCINWLRTLPYIRAWAQSYKSSGLVVIGAHTPEFPFEHTLENVRRATAAMNVNYPVAVDSDYGIWRGFNNQYWPAVYLFDAKGRVRHHQFGEGEYPATEEMIQQLLTESGARDVAHPLTPVEARGIEAAADWGDLRSAENYVGSARTEGFVSPGGGPGNPVGRDQPRRGVAIVLGTNPALLLWTWQCGRRHHAHHPHVTGKLRVVLGKVRDEEQQCMDARLGERRARWTEADGIAHLRIIDLRKRIAAEIERRAESCNQRVLRHGARIFWHRIPSGHWQRHAANPLAETVIGALEVARDVADGLLWSARLEVVLGGWNRIEGCEQQLSVVSGEVLE